MASTGSLTFVFNLNANAALVLGIIPPVIYLGLCFKLKTDTQINIAAVMSIIYAFLMLVVTMSIIGELYSKRFNFMQTRAPLLYGLENLCRRSACPEILHIFFSLSSGAMVVDKTILTPSSMFVVVMAIIYIVTAIMHPQEINLLFYGLLYILCIPSAYLLLTIYSMVNMNNVSWGTRESKPAAGAAKPGATTPQTKAQKGRHQIYD